MSQAQKKVSRKSAKKKNVETVQNASAEEQVAKEIDEEEDEEEGGEEEGEFDIDDLVQEEDEVYKEAEAQSAE